MKRILPTIMLCVVSLSISAAVASDSRSGSSPWSFKRFDDAIEHVQQSMRVAASYGRTGNIVMAGIEAENALDRMTAEVMPLREAPPGWFAEDGRFASTLEGLSGILEEMVTAGAQEDGKTLWSLGQTYRAAVSDLYTRNGLYRIRDCFHDLTLAMDGIWHYRHNQPNFDDPATRAHVGIAAGKLAAAVQRCDGMAALEQKDNPAYARLMGGFLGSLEPLEASIAEGDLGRFINVIREQRSFERLLFLNFG